MWEFSIGYTVSIPSIRVRELVKRCCSCTWHLTCSTTLLSARTCECCNAGRQCTGCYCWGKCKNKGQLMPSPTTTRGLMGIFPQGADPPATNPRSTTPPVRSPKSLSIRAISAARARERTTTEAGRGHRGHKDQVSSDGVRGERRRARQGDRDANSDEWNFRINEELDVDTEEEGRHQGSWKGATTR